MSQQENFAAALALRAFLSSGRTQVSKAGGGILTKIMNREIKHIPEMKLGPFLPVEIARDLWLALHKTRNSIGVCETNRAALALEKNEETLYQFLTERFCMEAAIVNVEIEDGGTLRAEKLSQPPTSP